MMTEAEILIEVAKVDGWREDIKIHKGSRSIHYIQFEGEAIEQRVVFSQLPQYLTSRDAIISVIAKQDRGTKTALLYWLERDPWSAEKIMDAVLLAAPMRLAVALLKAKGKWRE